MKKTILFLFIFAVLVRLYFALPGNIILGFDQARDLLASWSIWKDLDLKIIGPTAGNNTALHHGILFLYYIFLPLMIFKGSLIAVVVWNSLFNAGITVVLFFFAKDLFKSKKTGVIAAVLAGVSLYLIEYSPWLSNPSPTLLTVPLFFYFLWKFWCGKPKSPIFAAIFLVLCLF